MILPLSFIDGVCLFVVVIVILDVCCSLCAGCWGVPSLLRDVCCLLSVITGSCCCLVLLFGAVCCLLFVNLCCCLLFVVRCVSVGVGRLIVVCCSLFVVSCLLVLSVVC